MIQFNPGNLLKFNASAAWQRQALPGTNRLPFGLKCPLDNGVPFQLYFPSGAGVVSWKMVNPVDPTGGTFIAMTAGDLVVTQRDPAGFWVTYTGLAGLTTPVTCGFWEAWVTVDGVVYKSEVMHFRESTEADPIYRIRFTSATDKGNVLYSVISYNQFLYPTKWAFDRITIDREVEVVVDGNGTETKRFTRTTSRLRLEVADIPDYCVDFLSKCGDLETVQFEDLNGTIAVVPMVNTTFETRSQGIGLNIGIFTFDNVVEAFNGCQPDFTVF